jgi:hypothetical protein
MRNGGAFDGRSLFGNASYAGALAGQSGFADDEITTLYVSGRVADGWLTLHGNRRNPLLGVIGLSR